MNPFYLCVYGLKPMMGGMKRELLSQLLVDKYHQRFGSDQLARLISADELLDASLDELNTLLLQIDEDDFELAGNNPNDSLVLIFSKVVVKIFHHGSKMTELAFLKSHESKYWINVLESVNNSRLKAIVYPRMKPLTTIDLQRMKYLDVLRLLRDISIGLYDLHKVGYVHGDPGHTNLAWNSSNWVLLDFEDIKSVGNDYVKFFEDIQKLVEDIKINSSYRKELTELWDEFKKPRTKETETTVMFLGKPKVRKIVDFSYSLYDFSNYLTLCCLSVVEIV